MSHTHDLELGETVVRKRFVSWDRGEAEREWAALRLLHDHAPGLAPEPIALEEEDGAPVVVMTRLPGRPLGGATLTPEQTAAYGDALARLFAVPVPPGTPARAAAPDEMRAHVVAGLARPHDLKRCLDPGLVDDAVTVARAWLGDDHAATEDDRHADPPVLARGDGNLDNALWDGVTVRLVDFEEHGASTLAYELADVVEHAAARLERRLDPHALLSRFDLTPRQRMTLDVHRTLFAAFWLLKLLPGEGGFDRNPPGSTEDQARRVLELIRPTADRGH